jgi:O-antigen/teichoic acid export membrane protein
MAKRLKASDKQARHIAGNAGSLFGATAITSGFGFLYWWFAARNFTPDEVGFAAASVSAMMLLGTVAALGLGTLLMGEVSKHPGSERALVGTALMTSGGFGAFLGACFALVARFLTSDLEPLSSSLLAVLMFAAGVGMTAQSIVADQALLGFLRGNLQLGRNLVFSLGKLLILAAVVIWLGAATGMDIFATWIVGSALSLAFLALVTGACREPLEFLLPRPHLVRRFWNPALGHHLMNIAISVPALALPLVAAVVMTARESAFTYTTWLVAGFVFVPPYAIAMSLFAVASRDPSNLPRLMRFALTAAASLNVASILVIWAAAEVVLAFFGPEYAAEAAWPLRIVVLGAFPLVLKDNFVVAARVQGTLFRASVWLFLGSMVEIAGAVIGAIVAGLPGLAVGWLIGLSVECCLLAPTVLRVAFTSSPRRQEAVVAG